MQFAPPSGSGSNSGGFAAMKTLRQLGIHKKHIITLNEYRICTVDAFGVRESSHEAEEFTLHGTQPEFPRVVPASEVWISRLHFPREGIFLMVHALALLGAHARGKSEDDADEAGLEAERAAREKVTGEEFRDSKPHKRVPERIYDQLYTTIPDPEGPVKVWLIDGCLARCWYKTDYAEGGHFVVYPWVPSHEIWLERDTDPREMPFIAAHEYLELRVMRDGGLSYDEAHEIASKIEFRLRCEESGLPLAHGRRLRKSDLPSAADPEVYEYAEKHYLKG
jgi:hypothetical protein